MEQQAVQRLEGESSAQASQDVVTKGSAGCDTCLNGEDSEAAGKDLESGREKDFFEGDHENSNTFGSRPQPGLDRKREAERERKRAWRQRKREKKLLTSHDADSEGLAMPGNDRVEAGTFGLKLEVLILAYLSTMSFACMRHSLFG